MTHSQVYALSVIANAYFHVHQTETCNSPRSMVASLRAMDILTRAGILIAGSERKFYKYMKEVKHDLRLSQALS